jgi:hypothetical protein
MSRTVNEQGRQRPLGLRTLHGRGPKDLIPRGCCNGPTIPAEAELFHVLSSRAMPLVVVMGIDVEVDVDRVLDLDPSGSSCDSLAGWKESWPADGTQ